MAGPAHIKSRKKEEKTNKQRAKMSFSCHASPHTTHLHARAPGHIAASLPRGPDLQSEGDCTVHLHPIPLPKSIQQTLFWQQLGFSSQRSSSLGCHSWGREASLGAGLPWLSKSDRVQGDGGPSRRWVTDVHVASGCLWGWEVKHRGAAPSMSTVWSRHSSPSLLLPQHRPFYSFVFARPHGLRCAKNVQKHADNGLFPLRTWSLLQALEVNTEKESPES